MDANIKEVIYYDDVSQIDTTGYGFKSVKAFHPQGLTKGLITGTLIRNLETNEWYKALNYYDYKSRNIQTLSKNNVGGIDRSEYQYRFNGEILKMRMTHKKSSVADIVELYEYGYDHLGRKVSFTHNGNVVAKYEYDAIGRLQTKKFRPAGTALLSSKTGNWNALNTWQSGVLPLANDNVTINTGQTVTIPNGQTGSAGILNDKGVLRNFGTLNMGKFVSSDLYTETFKYHIRGNLRGINLDVNNNLTNVLFSMKLGYETENFYDGNIGKQEWKSNLDNVTRSFTFSYDVSSRIIGASYAGSGSENYSVDNMTYDLNGNLKTLNRKGKTGTNSWNYIDQLSYVYQPYSNKIKAVNDAILVSNPNVGDFRDSSSLATQYTYNRDGSLNSDDNKRISFEWNYLKKPKKITKANGQWEKFQYDASGKLLQTETSTGKITDFVGNLTYQNNILYQIAHDEGRINASGQYEYDINDHAKNLRVTFRDSSGIAKIVTKLDYDPWGFRLKGLDYYANYQTFNKFKTFSGKQLHDDFGFNLLSYKFRFHDPALGRFVSLDPLSEQYSHNSTFAFAENKLGLGVEYEGLEMMPFPIFGELPPVIVEPAISRPMIEPVTRLLPEAIGRTVETVGRTSRFTPEQKANFARGNKVEAEQLEKLGVQKNTKPIEATDPKTGQKGTTTPDAIKDGQTMEVKNVSKQSLTRQLRLQKDFSNSNGKDPLLRINQGAKVSEPLKNSGFEIQYYTPLPAKVDNTNVQPAIKNIIAPPSNPCNGNPNCT